MCDDKYGKEVIVCLLDKSKHNAIQLMPPNKLLKIIYSKFHFISKSNEIFQFVY